MTDCRTIAVVTSSRADYGHLYWVLRELEERAGVELQLIVTGAHLSPEFGMTVGEIERDGFAIAHRLETLLSSDTDVGMAKSIGLATMGFADWFGGHRPDILLLIADRYEMLSPASAALAMRIPMAHIEGGEVSEGAIDQQVRNALTMMSHIHFTPTEMATRRVLAMGEEEWRVHRVGAPSLDHLRRSVLPPPEVISQELGISLEPGPMVVAYHPVTLERDTVVEAEAMFGALGRLADNGRDIVFCFPNADAGSRKLIELAEGFCERHSRARLFVNLNHLMYWGLLKVAGCLVGNSSSGIMETASLGLPTVNVGRRQEGRERAGNVIDVPPESNPPVEGEIVEGVHRALSPGFRASLEGLQNPYGDGRAAERMVEVLAGLEVGDSARLLHKRGMVVPEITEETEFYPPVVHLHAARAFQQPML